MRVTVSYAQTLDGRIATRTGESQWIGGPESLQLEHELRATHDAVLVGVGTVIADNPRLTTRLVEGPSPLRVIADSGLRVPMTRYVVTESPTRTVVITTERCDHRRREDLLRAGVEVAIVRQGDDGRVAMADLIRHLASRGVESILVEGGAQVITSVLRSSLCDRIVVSISPRIVGEGIQAVGDLGISHLRDALNLTLVAVRHYGGDVVLDATLAAVPVA